jgi:hypothetical protein
VAALWLMGSDAGFAEGKPMLSGTVESHPNVAKSATLGWGTRPPNFFLKLRRVMGPVESACFADQWNHTLTLQKARRSNEAPRRNPILKSEFFRNLLEVTFHYFQFRIRVAKWL